MAETDPLIIDAWSPEMVAALGWRGEILTDETATVAHRLVAANALVETLDGLRQGEHVTYATLPTAIAAMTGRLPLSSHAFNVPDETIFSMFHDPKKQSELWNNSLAAAHDLSRAEGEPFYYYGSFKDVGLVLPVRGAAPHTVHTEIQWRHGQHTHTLDMVSASIVFMGLRGRYAAAQNSFVGNVQIYKRSLGIRTGASFDIPTSVGIRTYDFGIPAVRAALARADERQRQEIAARQYPDGSDDRYDFGTPEECDRHIQILRYLYHHQFANGVILGDHTQPH